MKKLYQTVVDPDKGDCMRAALASMFELDITQVPNFLLFGESEWFQVYWHFLLGIGYEYQGEMKPSQPIGKHDMINDCINASVCSRTFEGKYHEVLIDHTGLVIHDPNPNGLWLNESTIKSGDLVCWYSITKQKGPVR